MSSFARLKFSYRSNGTDPIAGCGFCENSIVNNGIGIGNPENEYSWVVHRILVHQDYDFARIFIGDQWCWAATARIAAEDPNRAEIIAEAATVILEAL